MSVNIRLALGEVGAPQSRLVSGLGVCGGGGGEGSRRDSEDESMSQNQAQVPVIGPRELQHFLLRPAKSQSRPWRRRARARGAAGTCAFLFPFLCSLPTPAVTEVPLAATGWLGGRKEFYRHQPTPRDSELHACPSPGVERSVEEEWVLLLMVVLVFRALPPLLKSFIMHLLT